MAPRPTRLVVSPSAGGERIDVALARLAGMSRRRARRLLAEGSVHRNGQPCRVQSRLVDAGDVLDVLAEVETAAPPAPEVVLRHEDRWLVVADKPAGVLSQPASGRNEIAFDALVLLALAAREGRRPYLRMVHRLDRQTSGLVLFARAPQALPELTRAWGEGRVEREYLAIVDGVPEEEQLTVTAPIGRDQEHRWRFRVDPDRGRPASTEVRRIACSGGRALVRCRLLTGRTHQVRVHLASIGHPVTGDRLYGGSSGPRPLLHAARLALPHPRTGELLEVESPLPEDMPGP